MKSIRADVTNAPASIAQYMSVAASWRETDVSKRSVFVGSVTELTLRGGLGLVTLTDVVSWVVGKSALQGSR